MTNQKYELLDESLKAIAEDKINILILVGEAGMSKTYNTISYLRENNINYEYVSSYSTPLSFYEILYKNSEKDVVVFDDISSIGNSLIISLLKSACWTFNHKKIVSYNSTSKVLEERGLPESFEFKGRVILIFNQELNRMRDEYLSLFLTNYRDNNRKRVSFDFVYKFINYIYFNKINPVNNQQLL